MIAAILPFLTVFGAFKIAGAVRKPPPSVADLPVRHFSDYVAKPQELAPRLGNATVVWRDPDRQKAGPNADTGIAFLGDRLMIVGFGKLIVLGPHGSELRRLALHDDERGRLRAAWHVTAGADRDEVWIYNTLTGAFGRFDVESDAGPTEVTALDEVVVQPHWFKGRIIANGFFEDELLRVYSGPLRATERVPESAPSGEPAVRSAVVPQLIGTFGQPLFPRIVNNISRQLSYNRFALSPKANKLVLAFRWSNRLNVYDASTLMLERSIAGPHESKLDFAVGRTPDGWPAFSLSDESTFCYLDVAASQQGIVALYSGRELRRFRGAASLGTELHIFGWDGRTIAIRRLPEAVYRIAFDESRGDLYGLRSPDREVVKVHAPDLFHQPAAAVRTARSTR